MTHRLTNRCCLVLGGILLGLPLTAQAEDAKPAGAAGPKINFQEHILPLFKSKCGMCHGADQAKGGLVIDTYTATMQGGASGEIVVPGDLDGSRLWALVTHKEQPAMPPKEPKMPDDQLNLIKQWIELGALETATSAPKIKKKANFSLGTATISAGKPEGPPPMPENFPTDPLLVTPQPNAVTALAASPWAPLLAVSGHKQVLLYHTQENRLIGVLPFPEGQPYVLRFSRNGSLLLAGGGRGGQSGRVVVWDVKTGQRVFEIGDEKDSVLAADISADHSQIALGGPKKIVRVYSTKDGELMYEIKKHTDWITALEFSPDGVLLATADRANGVIVWEAFTGREFYVLNGHQAGITGVSWRADANALATCSEDTTIKLWEMTNGTMYKNWGAHGGGAASVQFTRDGRILSTGRDRVTKLWDQNGGQQRAFPAHNDLGLKVTFIDDEDKAVAGDWTGSVRVWNAKDGAELPSLTTNPPALATRIEQAGQGLQVATAAAAQTTAQVAAIKKAQADREAAAQAAQKLATDAQQALDVAKNEKTAADQVLVTKAAAVTTAETAFNAAKTKVDAVTAEKAAADKALVDAGEDKDKKAAAEKLIAEKTEALKVATDSFNVAKTELDKSVAEKAVAEKAVADLANKVKAATDNHTNLLAAAQKAVEVAKVTPEYSKMLADAEAANQAAQQKQVAAQQLVEKLNAEKGRAFAAAPAK